MIRLYAQLLPLCQTPKDKGRLACQTAIPLRPGLQIFFQITCQGALPINISNFLSPTSHHTFHFSLTAILQTYFASITILSPYGSTHSDLFGVYGDRNKSVKALPYSILIVPVPAVDHDVDMVSRTKAPQYPLSPNSIL